LELPGGGRVLFTTREHGNLATDRGPRAQDGACVRESLRKRLGLYGLVHARQVHGTTVQRFGGAADGFGLTGEGAAAGASTLDAALSTALGPALGEPPSEFGAPAAPAGGPQADGHATALPGVGVMVLVADCLPVALAGDGAVAMLHAGWRGLAAGVLEEGVRALREVGGRGQMSAVIGPGAGVCCYEVGDDVHDKLGAGHPHREGRHLDMRALARERLRNAGVAQIEDVPLCTVCEQGLFSHRREGDAAGRQAGIAWLS
jgi:YfiH family protein